MPLGKRCWQRPSFGASDKLPDKVPDKVGAGGTGRGRDEPFFDVTAGISMAELEFVVVEFMFSS